jgi:flagellar biogenesis protein FliO
VVGALWLLRKRNCRTIRLGSGGSRRGPQLIESQGKLVFGAQHSMHLIRAGDRQILIGIHPAGFTVIGDLNTAAAEEARPLP